MSRFFSIMCAVPAVILLASLQGTAWAIGQLQVDSRIGQPFKAHVVIPAASPFNNDRLAITLAPAYAYLGAGIPAQARLGQLAVAVEEGDGGKVVYFSSEEPVNKLFVQFIADIHGDAHGQRQRWSQTFSAILDQPPHQGHAQGHKQGRPQRTVTPPADIHPPAAAQKQTAHPAEAAKQEQRKQPSQSMDMAFGHGDKQEVEAQGMDADFGHGDKQAESHGMGANFGHSEKQDESQGMDRDFGHDDKQVESHGMGANFGHG